MDFNPRSPRGGATGAGREFVGHLAGFQSTLPTRGSDAQLCQLSPCLDGISIHAPHEGERLLNKSLLVRPDNFNPRSPRGGATVFFAGAVRAESVISIHAPHEGERHGTRNGEVAFVLFQSTLPTRGSDTMANKNKNVDDRISIHAPHEGERRCLVDMQQSLRMNFNPRSPRGGATGTVANSCSTMHISIHAPHEGERHCHQCIRLYDKHAFQSTLPTRGSD